MRPYIVMAFTIVCSFIHLFAGTRQELPKTYLGEYRGKITISKKTPQNGNIKEDVIELGAKKAVKWQMIDLISGKTILFSGSYSILTENEQSYSLLCSVSSRQGNATFSIKFYLTIPMSGSDITYTDNAKMRTVTLKKK